MGGNRDAAERLRSEDLRSFLQIADEAAGILRETGEARYRHIIVDEAQDLHPAQWRLLRAAVPPGPDDLFLVGDPHQRIWQHRVSMRDTGVHIVGRTQRLTVSYRTTQEILDWAVRVLGLAPADELDGWPDSLDGYESPCTDDGRSSAGSRAGTRSARPPSRRSGHGWPTALSRARSL